MRTVEIVVEQISIVKGDAIISGHPVNDATKVVIASGADVMSALLMAVEWQEMDEEPILDVPEDNIRAILERPVRP